MSAAQSRVLFFLHIPKNGGITLNHIIERQYPRQSVLWFSYDRPDQISRFRAMGEDARSKLRCLGGHYPFGVHEEFGDISAPYITMLRNPIERFVSEYGQLKRVERSGAWSPPKDRMATLSDYLEYRVETNSLDVQTRFVSGYLPPPGSKPPFDPLPEDALERAKANIKEQFLVAGLTERFDESLLLMKRRLGWQGRISYARKNAAPKPVSYDDIPADLLERITESTKIDAELFRYTEALLSEAIAEEGADFQEELERLKKANHRYFVLSAIGKLLFPPRLRNAPGIRHARGLVRRALGLVRRLLP